MRHKTASILSIILILGLFVLGPAIFVYIVDPFQIYHRSVFKEAKYSKEQGFQHAGWINRLLADPKNNYQAIVVGSSVMANYTQTLINRHLPWGNTLNLSVNGSTPLMQSAIARYALEKNPNIKHILWDVHFFYVFDAGPDSGNRTELQFPAYLYNHQLLDDSPYLFNSTNIETGLKFLAGDFTEFNAGVEDNGPFYQDLIDQNRFNLYSSQENRKNVLLPLLTDAQLQLPDRSYYLNHKFSSIDDHMLDVLLPLCNTDVDINITFSPVNRYYYASKADLKYIYNQILMRRYIVEHTQSCSNIHVFAFDNLDWIVNNLHNYADDFHYDISINNYIIESIAKNENRLTMENIGQYETLFIQNINNYKKIFLADLDRP